MTATTPTFTDRLDLRRPVRSDADELFAINADPRVWAHFPAQRHESIEQTLSAMGRWEDSWRTYGLGTWTVRKRGDDRVIGYGGCTVLGGEVWNLGYRLAADEHGHGYATELARAAVARAQGIRPGLPVIAYLLEHNEASAGVARKLGLTLVHRGPDAGNPDPGAIRLVFADRDLTAEQLAATLV